MFTSYQLPEVPATGGTVQDGAPQPEIEWQLVQTAGGELLMSFQTGGLVQTIDLGNSRIPPEAQALLAGIDTATLDVVRDADDGTLLIYKDDKLLLELTGEGMTFYGDETGTVATQVNMRGGSGTENPVTGRFAPGDSFTVVGQNEEGTWLQVKREDGSTGWVSTPLVTQREHPEYPVNFADISTPTPMSAPIKTEGVPTPQPPVSPNSAPAEIGQAENNRNEAEVPTRIVDGESREWILQQDSVARGQALDMRIYIDPITKKEGAAYTNQPDKFNPANVVYFDVNPPSSSTSVDLSKIPNPTFQNKLITANTLGLPATGTTGSQALENSILWMLAKSLNQTPQKVVADINNGSLSQLQVGDETWFLSKGVNLMMYRVKLNNDPLPGGTTGGLKWGISVGNDGALSINVFVQDSNPDPATNDPARTLATISALEEMATQLNLEPENFGGQKIFPPITKLLMRIGGSENQSIQMSPFVTSR